MDKQAQWDIERVIKALEKQIPQKIKKHKGLNETACPECGIAFGYYEYDDEKFDYCYNCGQKLDWESEVEHDAVGRVQTLEDAGLMIVDKQEIDKLKEKLNAVLQDFYQYVQGGKEICAFCLHDYECEPGETICEATYKGFKWRGLNEKEDL